MARVRSKESYGAQLSILIYRKDFEDKEEQFWGSYDAQELATKLKMTGEEFNRNIKVEFEIDQELNIKLLFCKGKPHYLISLPDNDFSLNAAEIIKTDFSSFALIIFVEFVTQNTVANFTIGF